MTIMYLTPGCFDKGGISRYTRYQASALRDLLGAARVRVYSVHGRREGDFEVPFDADFVAGGLAVKAKARLVARVLADAIRLRPKVVHAAHVNLSALAHTAARLAKARSVVNVYGLEVWSGMRRDAAWGLAQADLVISDCHFTARYVSQNGLRKDGRTAVLWDCVDTARFHPGNPSRHAIEKYGIPDPSLGINVLTLGRMSSDAAHKGYERLLEAFRRSAPAAPELRLVYAGRGELAEHLRRDAAAAGLASRVFFTGAVHEDDLADVYRTAHIFSLVSDRGVGRGEGIPLTPLEAGSCGIPLIVGHHDGSQEAVAEGENGFVLDPFDIDMHARRLVELASDPALRHKMSVAARQRVLRLHDYEVFRREQGRLLEDELGVSLRAGRE